ncbi:MAG: RNA polymerase subunit sigma-70 [Sporichthyaceae bacterium]|nr:RNA polymerase subunit sigma-70 [Sporichthyaceae bacterium]
MRRVQTRKPPPDAIHDALEQLRELVAQREEATVAVDREVNRLRRLGARWPDIAGGLGVSRQAARQKYTVRGQP